MNPDLTEIFEVLQEIKEDEQTPKIVKQKIDKISIIFKENELNIAAAKAISELEDVTTNSTIMPHTRSMLFSVMNLLEQL